MKDKDYKEGLKHATDAIIASKARHAMEREESMNPLIDRVKSKLVKKNLATEKADNIENLIHDADKVPDKISVNIEDDKLRPDLKSIEGEFIDHGVMSLHHPKREGRELICKNRSGKQHEILPKENDIFIKKVLNKDPKKLYQKKLKLAKKKVGLRESEFSDDLENMFPEFKLKKLKLKKKN